jgi:hypothetical protein
MKKLILEIPWARRYDVSVATDISINAKRSYLIFYKFCFALLRTTLKLLIIPGSIPGATRFSE